MKINSSLLNVNLNENNNNNENFFYKLLRTITIIKLEYIISSIIAVFTLTYYTMNTGYLSYNLIINNNLQIESLNSDYAYLSLFRDYADEQWKYIRCKYFTYIFLLIISIPIGRVLKNQSIAYYKKYMVIVGIFFSFYLMQFRFIYIILSAVILYYTRFLQDIIISEKIYVLLNYLILLITKIIFEYFRNNHDINNINLFKNFNKIDNVSYQCLYIISLFKMISFNMEYKISSLNRYINNNNYIENVQKAKEHCEKCSTGEFCSECLDNALLDKNSDFSFLNFIFYIFYPYLLYNGPIIHYNNFIFQINNYTHSEHNTLFNISKLLYLLKYILIFLVLEFYNHFIYSISIFKNISEPQNYLTLFYYCFFLLHILIFIYMKWYFIWKTGILLSYLDGIYIENNSKIILLKNITGFCRGWNCSVYRWIVKYLYSALDGEQNKFWNVIIIFGFFFVLVDFSLKYFSIIICCIILFSIEIYVKEYACSQVNSDDYWYLRYSKYLYNCICFSFICCICLSVYGFNVSNMLGVIRQIGGIFCFILIILFILPIIIMSFFLNDIEKQNENEYNRLDY
jgi:D-alanyl-lipoteichoic acid acyltransferase DltB (MBOAT superfamily)